VIAVCIEEPFTRVPDHAWTYRSYLLRRVPKRDAIDTAVRDLPEVVGVRADPKMLPKVVRSGGIEVDRLSRLCRLSACCERRTIVRRIPEIVNAPAGLDTFDWECGNRA
jgi:hypothetical protein